jgi:hypothetical protein
MQASDGSPRVKVGLYFEFAHPGRSRPLRRGAVIARSVRGIRSLRFSRIAAIRSPLQNLPGPENAHQFKGSFVNV